jgi:leader peptidase (prepilin peptidase) / N-methyltransferase
MASDSDVAHARSRLRNAAQKGSVCLICAILPALAAPFIGSLLGVLIVRLPLGRPVFMARSQCESCARALGPLALVPVLSFGALRGRCRPCRAPIGAQHLAVELASVGIAVWAMTIDTNPTSLWIDCGLGWTLLALAWIDWQHFRLPDALTLPLLLAGLAATWFEAPEDITDHALGAVLGYLGFRALAWVYRAMRGRDGLGLGDAKLLAVAGAWLGGMALPHLILLAAVCGIGVALATAWRRGQLNASMAIPFGPCLALAIWIVRLYGV